MQIILKHHCEEKPKDIEIVRQNDVWKQINIKSKESLGTIKACPYCEQKLDYSIRTFFAMTKFDKNKDFEDYEIGQEIEVSNMYIVG